jgi:hypothetical protein
MPTVFHLEVTCATAILAFPSLLHPTLSVQDVPIHHDLSEEARLRR